MTALVAFDHLAGVPVHWGYLGRTGSRKLMPAFLATLEQALSALWEACPYGRAEAIVSAGAYVPRPPTPGDRHSTGTAFDLVTIHWPGAPPLLAANALTDSRRYLATEAVLRRHVPQVLDWWQGADHHGHWHLDDRAEAAGWSPQSRSDVSFVQACLTHVLWRPVDIDGVLGPQTQAALRSVLGELLVAQDVDTPAGWAALLDAVARVGWGRVEAG